MLQNSQSCLPLDTIPCCLSLCYRTLYPIIAVPPRKPSPSEAFYVMSPCSCECSTYARMNSILAQRSASTAASTQHVWVCSSSIPTCAETCDYGGVECKLSFCWLPSDVSNECRSSSEASYRQDHKKSSLLCCEYH